MQPLFFYNVHWQPPTKATALKSSRVNVPLLSPASVNRVRRDKYPCWHLEVWMEGKFSLTASKISKKRLPWNRKWASEGRETRRTNEGVRERRGWVLSKVDAEGKLKKAVLLREESKEKPCHAWVTLKSMNEEGDRMLERGCRWRRWFKRDRERERKKEQPFRFSASCQIENRCFPPDSTALANFKG